MILTCPSCATRYMADAVSFQPSGREVRCANCGHRWFQDPPADLPLKALPNYSGLAATTLPPAGVVQDRHRRLAGQLVGWIGLVAAVAGVAYAILAFRIEIVRLWPESASLYAVLGQPVNARGLIFRNASFEEEKIGGVRALLVMGEIVNVTDSPLLLPGIRISLRDAKRREVFDWTADPPVARLEARAVETFVTRLTSPPQQAQDLVIRFAPQRQEQAAEPAG